MSLINPLLLALGVVALSVPIWVHLRHGKVKKRVVVGSLRLLAASPQSSRSPRRLIRRPLLLLRCLITLLIAMGFARLLVPWLGEDPALGYSAIVLDASASMQAKNAKSSAWKIAQDAALEHVERLSPSARVAVIVSPSNGVMPEWMTPAEARGFIRKLRPGFAENHLNEDIQIASAALQNMPSDYGKTLHMISDFQRTSFAQIDQTSIPQSVKLEITKTSMEKPTNRGVAVSVVRAGVSNLRLYTYNDSTPGTIKLCEDNSSHTTDIKAGAILGESRAQRAPDGWTSRKLSMDDSDDLRMDNLAFDVFKPQDEIHVWLWEPEQAPGSAGPKIGSSTYFISRALQPTEASGDSISLFRPKSVSVQDLDIQHLPALLIIPSQETYPEELVVIANAIIFRGGSVLFFGGKHLTANSLSPFGDLVPVMLKSIEKVPFSPALEKIEPHHPIFGSLGADARQRLSDSPLLLRHDISIKPSSNILASFIDGKPLVVEAEKGKGKVFFVNTSADREFGDLPADAPRFIPAVHLLMAKALGGLNQALDDAPLVSGQSHVLKLDPLLAGKWVSIDGVDHMVTDDGSVPAVVFKEPGLKSVDFDGVSLRKYAVNFPPSESNLDNLPEIVIRQRLEGQRSPDDGSSVVWENVVAGQLAWQLCLLIGAFLLLIEPLITDRKLRQ